MFLIKLEKFKEIKIEDKIIRKEAEGLLLLPSITTLIKAQVTAPSNDIIISIIKHSKAMCLLKTVISNTS